MSDIVLFCWISCINKINDTTLSFYRYFLLSCMSLILHKSTSFLFFVPIRCGSRQRNLAAHDRLFSTHLLTAVCAVIHCTSPCMSIFSTFGGLFFFLKYTLLNTFFLNSWTRGRRRGTIPTSVSLRTAFDQGTHFYMLFCFNIIR